MSKPVAHATMSKAISSPLAVTTPVSVKREISSCTTRTWSCTSVSRYPSPGVSLRHPGDHCGMNLLLSSSWPGPMRASMLARMPSRAWRLRLVPRRNRGNISVRADSSRLRYRRWNSGSTRNRRFSGSMYWCLPAGAGFWESGSICCASLAIWGAIQVMFRAKTVRFSAPILRWIFPSVSCANERTNERTNE